LGGVLPMLTIKNLPLITGFFVVEQQWKTHKKMGCTIVGKIPEYIKILDPNKFVQQIDLSQISQMPNSMKKLFRIFRIPIRICFCYFLWPLYKLISVFKSNSNFNSEAGVLKIVSSFDHRVDKLWERSKKFISCAQVRNSAYINWQFSVDLGWTKAIYIKEDVVLGYAIISIKSFEKDHQLSGLRVLSIIDIFWDFSKKPVMNSMLELIKDYGKKNHADLILCSIADNFARKCLYKNFFFKIPSTVYFFYTVKDKSCGLSPKIADWFFTRGDADAAGSLGPSL